jgi:anhydro-N-acetylmuramic acid kinase
MEELGVPAQAKEAVAFALMGWMTWFGLPGNVPSATGAKRAVVLGKVTHG